MFSTGKSIPPPPSAARPRNNTLGATLSTYRDRPSKPSSNGVNFSAMRSMFESASKPEVRNVVASIAKKPLVQKVAVSAARNEQVRNAALLSAQNPAVQRSMMDTLLNYSRPATTASGGSSQKPSVEEIARQFETKPIMGCSVLPPIISKKPASIYPLLTERDPFDFPPQLPPFNHLHSSPLSNSVGQLMGSEISRYSWCNNNSNTQKTTPAESSIVDTITADYEKFSSVPQRPPPPLATTNLMTFADDGCAASMSTAASSPNPLVAEPHAIVKYPYHAANLDELTCEPGDIVLLKREVDDQWIYATNTRTGQSGIVPTAFLHVKIPLVPTCRNGGGKAAENVLSVVYAQALYDYDTGVDGDLKGNAIVVVARVNDDWLRGELAGQMGIFPLNFVSLSVVDLLRVPDERDHNSKDIGLTALKSQLDRLSCKYRRNGGAGLPPVGSVVTAAYDYASDVEADLQFQAGDMIEVIGHESSEWLNGRLVRNEHTGLVPITYIIPWLDDQ